MKKRITLPALATAFSALSFGIGAVTFANKFPYNPVSYAQVVLGVAAGIVAGVMIGRRLGAPKNETLPLCLNPSDLGAEFHYGKKTMERIACTAVLPLLLAGISCATHADAYVLAVTAHVDQPGLVHLVNTATYCKVIGELRTFRLQAAGRRIGFSREGRCALLV